MSLALTGVITDGMAFVEGEVACIFGCHAKLATNAPMSKGLGMFIGGRANQPDSWLEMKLSTVHHDWSPRRDIRGILGPH